MDKQNETCTKISENNDATKKSVGNISQNKEQQKETSTNIS
jgi:hypothetical protein